MMLAVIYTDKEFKAVVRNLANGSIGPEAERLAVLSVSKYMWNSMNWDRLSETPHGSFIREHSVNNPVPDLALRALYRKQVLADNNFEE